MWVIVVEEAGGGGKEWNVNTSCLHVVRFQQGRSEVGLEGGWDLSQQSAWTVPC